MGRSMTKKARAEYNHTWNDDDRSGTYFYRNYKLCYLTIVRYMPGEKDPTTKKTYEQITYIPSINGFRLHNRGGGIYNDEIPHEFSTLNEAKAGAMNQVDKNIESAKNFKYVLVEK